MHTQTGVPLLHWIIDYVSVTKCDVSVYNQCSNCVCQS